MARRHTTLADTIGLTHLHEALSMSQRKLILIEEFRRNVRVTKQVMSGTQIILFDEFLLLRCKIVVQKCYVTIAMRIWYQGIDERIVPD